MESIIKVTIPTEEKCVLPSGTTVTSYISIAERKNILDKLCNEVKAAFEQDNSIDRIYVKLTQEPPHIPSFYDNEYECELPF